MNVFKVNKVPMELWKLVKLNKWAESGPAAQELVTTGAVTLNGEKETQKRKKIIVGHVLKYKESEIKIELFSPEERISKSKARPKKH
ncbi:MAG: RNA-binding S4 domain-containing protein [Fibrobacterales bacterium]